MQSMLFVSSFMSLAAIAAATDHQITGNGALRVTTESGLSKSCPIGDQAVIARLANDGLVLEVGGVRLSWIMREQREDGNFVFVALDPQVQGYPLGFALISFEDRVKIFAPPDAGLQPAREDLRLVHCQ